jgi:hypothetical protein
LSPRSQRGQRLGAKTRITILMQALATRLRALSLVGAVRRRQALYSFGWRLVRFRVTYYSIRLSHAVSPGFWLASLILLIIDWRSGNLTSPPRDTPFTRPDADIEEGEEVEEEGHSYQPVATNTAPTYPHQSTYDNSNASASPFADSNRLSSAPTNTSTTYLPTTSTTYLPTSTNRFSTADSSANRTSAYSTAPTTTTAPTSTNYAASRPSMDAYGAFSDPAPSGFGGVSASYAPTASESGSGAPRVSRTMQYADPYAAVRASLATSTGTGAPAPTKSSYEPYTGYQ